MWQPRCSTTCRRSWGTRALRANTPKVCRLAVGWLVVADLCRVLKDSRKNKGRSVQALVEHMTTDPLVQWAWSPGERTPPSIGQREFHELVRRWAQTGAVCPR